MISTTMDIEIQKKTNEKKNMDWRVREKKTEKKHTENNSTDEPLIVDVETTHTKTYANKILCE